jgi:hypothetical protein
MLCRLEIAAKFFTDDTFIELIASSWNKPIFHFAIKVTCANQEPTSCASLRGDLPTLIRLHSPLQHWGNVFNALS